MKKTMVLGLLKPTKKTFTKSFQLGLGCTGGVHIKAVIIAVTESLNTQISQIGSAGIFDAIEQEL